MTDIAPPPAAPELDDDVITEARAPLTTESALEVLRRRPVATELLGGFGPLVVAAALTLAMVLTAPSIAPERIVEVPADATTEEAP